MILTKAQIIALQRLPGVGTKSILKIGDCLQKESYDCTYNDSSLNAEDLVDVLKNLKIKIKTSKDSTKREINIDDLNQALDFAYQILDKSEEQGIQVVSCYDNNFPLGLKRNIDDQGNEKPVLLLYYKGNYDLVKENCIAVIGSRSCLNEGKKAAKFIGQQFADRGFCIVSGLALGCDEYAHQGALQAKNGKTIAILANGLDTVYPKENIQLAEDILNNNGLLISSLPIGISSSRFSLIERDFYQASISIGTIVVQCSKQSGTMHAAIATRQQNKPLFVLKYNNPDIQTDEKNQGNIFLKENYNAKEIEASKNVAVMQERLDQCASEFINYKKSISQTKGPTSLMDSLLI